ncbi:hypothetical protein BV20DRAFT_371339 [Pilatotrama ljubarskyi]|nr:hypothetical protein BV20DRAFT_371339 [Pilatotrama ljubarskyi]
MLPFFVTPDMFVIRGDVKRTALHADRLVFRELRWPAGQARTCRLWQHLPTRARPISISPKWFAVSPAAEHINWQIREEHRAADIVKRIHPAQQRQSLSICVAFMTWADPLLPVRQLRSTGPEIWLIGSVARAYGLTPRLLNGKVFKGVVFGSPSSSSAPALSLPTQP